MIQNFMYFIYECFSNLVEKYGFRKGDEIKDSGSYSIKYISKNFTIKLEKYRREFYVTLYKAGSNKEINLFNLLSYLYQSSPNTPKSEYFSKESDIEESYKKQLNHISKVLYENFKAINDFFTNENYESKILDLEKYMLNKYPELFKKKL